MDFRQRRLETSTEELNRAGDALRHASPSGGTLTLWLFQVLTGEDTGRWRSATLHPLSGFSDFSPGDGV
ncbi:hypothetical protein EYF80_021559 [Liparis tanakae]|uniref:Uncharacterized protein n=1 Tax=Liparis tanakae TaxID=230148 RepID=A0A4Z2HR96_9TELE|nr:hypothetical protein EYF80_021559 [Liparis tanakae]